MSQLLDLSSDDVSNILSVFRSEFPTGLVSRSGFTRVFRNFLASKRTQLSSASVNDMVSRLFTIFDADGNGVVDSRELLAGLSIMSNAEGSDRIRTAFELFDTNGDGVVDLTEMTAYLTTVFRVIADSQPDTFRAHGVAPEELAAITARRCFQDADTDGNGVLSFDEFKRFYMSEGPLGGETPSPGTGNASKSGDAGDAPADILDVARSVTGLGSLAAKDVFAQLKAECPNGSLGRGDFTSAIFKVLLLSNALPTTPAAIEALPRILNQLFDRFDSDGNGSVDMTELASGLSLLCGGSRDDKIRAAFELYDINGDGVVSLDEMTSYLLSVFRVMLESDPSIQDSLSVPVEELARVTAEDCFHVADVNGDGSITFDEFKEWYSSLDAGNPALVGASAPAQSPANAAKLLSGVPSWLETARRVTGFEGRDIDDVLPMFAAAADGAGRLNRTAFAAAFSSFMDPRVKEAEKRTIGQLFNDMFEAFDTDRNGSVDYSELAAGLTLLCGTDQQDRVKTMFKVLDTNGDGHISKQEMAEYMTSVFTLLLASQEGKLQRMGLTPQDIAVATAEQCFEQADTNGDGVISFEEFSQWFTSGGGSALLQVVSPAHASQPPASTLDDARVITCLGALPVTQALSHFARFADDQGCLSRAAFLDCFDAITEPLSPDEHHRVERRRELLSRLFDAFDVDGNGRVDFAELSGGLSILCAGSADEKFDSAFLLFDEDGDGYISKAEMYRYLCSVFTVLVESDSATRQSVQTTVSELAKDTTDACFAAADTNRDGKLSRDEFKAWYMDKLQGVVGDATLSTIDAATSAPAPLSQIASALRLKQLQVREALMHILNYADDYLRLSKPAFLQAFAPLVVPNTNRDRANLLLNVLFGLFDTDGDGYIDAGELGVGVSVLCAGDSTDKVTAAFEAMDANKDGRLTPDEVFAYLFTVFRMLFAIDGGDSSSVNALAKHATQQCFAEADVDRDGVITLDEFLSWYSSGEETKTAPQSPHVVHVDADPLESLRQITGLASHKSQDVFEHFAHYASGDGTLSLEAYLEAFALFIPDDVRLQQDSDTVFSVRVALFRAFDDNRVGIVDFAEIMCALSVLCGDSRDAKVSAALSLISVESDGSLTKSDLTWYLHSVYKVLFLADPTLQQAVAMSPGDLAQSTAAECFLDLGLNDTARLSVSAFKTWYLTPPTAGQRAIAVVVGSKAPSPQAQSVPSPQANQLTIGQAKAVTGLEHCDAKLVHHALASVTDANGLVSHKAFIAAMDKLPVIAAMSSQDRITALTVLSDVFDLFDADDKEEVDFVELASGLTLLCGDDQDDKLVSVFNLYDFNGDGVISKAEMATYLRSVFRVMYLLAPSAQGSLGVSPEDLAVATTEQCFADADSNHDGVLTLPEFLAWSKASSLTAAGAGAQNVVLAAATSKSSLTLADIRALLGMTGCSLDDLARHFALFTDSKGNLSQANFNAAFRRFCKETTDPTLYRAVIQQLYTLFDVNHDGTVDFTELMAGLSIVCGGTGRQRVETAFKLFDSNGDGFIAFEEMVTYLSAVFRVLDAIEPESYSKAGIVPDELAAATAAECFAAADQNQDGLLSFEEFKAWYDETDSDSDTETPEQAPQPPAEALNDDDIMATIRQVLDLGEYTVHELAGKFAAQSNDDGELTRSAFKSVLQSLVTRYADEPADFVAAREGMMDSLFDIFDADHNHVVDLQELMCGLSMLCGGNSDTKIRAAFQLFDTNGDGFISLEEMQVYLTSVFRVMFATHPDTANRLGVSADALAEVTALQCFIDADTDGDGKLSWDEFKAWYSDSSLSALGAAAMPARDIILNSVSVPPRTETIDEARRLTNFGAFTVADVCSVFEGYTNSAGELDLAGFFEACQQFLPSGGMSPVDAEHRNQVLKQLFVIFDADGNGSVSAAELIAGLSVLCQGSKHEKLQAAFTLYDENGDGYISFEEMVNYLSAVFRVILASDADAASSVEVSAQDLALATAIQCFTDADTDGDGKLSFDEFARWYISDASEDNAVASSVVNLAAEVPSFLSVSEMKSLTGLAEYSVGEVASLFAQFADAEGLLSPDAFDAAFQAILASRGVSDSERKRAELLVRRLFSVFDRDNNGVVDFAELIAGLSILCGGSRDDKILHAFRMIDTDGDGLISIDEMTAYLTGVFKLVFESSQAREVATSPEELAKATALQCFEEADTDNDGYLSFEEYREWYNSAPGFGNQPAGLGSGNSDAGGSESGDDSAKFAALNDLRRALRLESSTVDELITVFQACEDESGNISKRSFERCLRALMLSKGASEADLARCRPLCDRLFATFDADGNGVVDHTELLTGISVLCAGSQDDKVRAMFELYDENGDGVISLEEMIKYLTSVYRVIYETVPGTAEQLGVSPEELASATAQRCFEEADVNGDGSLTLEEFKEWFLLNDSALPDATPTKAPSSGTTLPKGDNSPGRAAADYFEDVEGDSDSGVDSDDDHTALPPAKVIRAALKLDKFSIREVYDTFEEQAEEGVLDRSAFLRGLELLTKAAGTTLTPELVSLADVLFSLFDSNSNGVVDYDELAGGISVFCAGTTDEKVQAAFALYDVNGDGFMSHPEMLRYLTTIFRVMFRINPALRDAHDVDPITLATVTAAKAFEECDRNHDGLLSFDEFKLWYNSQE